MSLTPAQIHSKMLAFERAHPIGSSVRMACTHNWNAQCVDLVDAWASYLGKGCFFGGGDAVHIIDSGHFDPHKWRRVWNTPSGIPPEGSVIVVNHYSSSIGRWTGHTMIGLPRSSGHTILSYDQNWSRAHRITAETHVGYYTSNWHVRGWLIPL